MMVGADRWNEAVSDSALDACEASLAALRAAAAPYHAARQPAAALRLLADLVALTAPIMTRDNVPNSINEVFVTCIL